MATKKTDRVRYRVLKPVFVNGSVVDPKGRDDVFVMADPGLEGSSLKLAPEASRANAPAADKANAPKD